MLAIFDRIKNIFFPTNSHKRKLDDSIEILDDEKEYHNSSSILSYPDRLHNFEHQSVHEDIYCKKNHLKLVYKDTLSAIENSDAKKIKLDEFQFKSKRDSSSDVNLTINNNAENEHLNLTNGDVKNNSNTLRNNNFNLNQKTHLLDSRLIENILKPSIHAENRQKRLNYLQAESKVNKELIKKQESNFIEDITCYFRELCSFPPIVFPKASKKIVLPKITDSMKELIISSLNSKHMDFVLVEDFNLSITVTDLVSLQPRQWLTDNIINFYLELIYFRNNQSLVYPKIQILSTFFYPKLRSSGYNGVRRWTKKRPIFDSEMVLVPIHLGDHWCLVKVDFLNQEVVYYDSLKKTDTECLPLMKTFLIEDSKDKLGKPLNLRDWIFSQAYDGPTQNNGHDCGVFLSQTAEYLSRRSKLEFNEDHMMYFREKMSFEILSRKLL